MTSSTTKKRDSAQIRLKQSITDPIEHLYRKATAKSELLRYKFKSVKPTFDITDDEDSMNYKIQALKAKHLSMKIGYMWEIVVGSYKDFEYTGAFGLDIFNHKKRIAIELKNRTNTDNASARKTNYDKLAAFGNTHPEYTLVYGCINENTEKQTMIGRSKRISHNGRIIHYLTGYIFLKFIAQHDADELVRCVRFLLRESAARSERALR